MTRQLGMGEQRMLPLADPVLPSWPDEWTFVGEWVYSGIGFCSARSAGAATVRLRRRAIDAAVADGRLEQAQRLSYRGPGATPADLEIILPVGAPLPPRIEHLHRRFEVGSSCDSCLVIRRARCPRDMEVGP